MLARTKMRKKAGQEKKKASRENALLRVPASERSKAVRVWRSAKVSHLALGQATIGTEIQGEYAP